MQLEYYYICAALESYKRVIQSILPANLYDEECIQFKNAYFWLENLAIEEWCRPEKKLDIEWLPTDHISIRWHIDDVLSRDDSLTKEQARQVLQLCDRKHDAEQGINWGVIDYWISRVKNDE